VAYVGNQPARGQWRKLSDISSAFDGVITTFTTSVPPGTSQYFVTAGSASQLLISLGGVIQEPDVDYTVSTNSVTFTTPPTSGLSFFGVLCGDALNAGVPSDGSVTTSKLAGGLSVGLTGGSVSTPSLFFTGDDNTGVFSAGADQLNIATNGVERVEFGTSEVVFNDGGANYDFRIEGDTNANLFFVDASAEAVGIGTSSPSELLHIAGVTNPGIVLQDTTNNTDARIKTNNNGDLVFEADYNAEAADTRISFEIDGSEKARFDSSGRLGIGDSAPDALLVIKGNSDANTTPSIRLKDGTDTREAWITNSAGDLALNVGGDDNVPHGTLKLFEGGTLTYAQGAGERLRIDSSGKLLVGTSTAPTASVLNTSKLVVAGNAANTGAGTITLARGSAVTVADQFAGEIFFTDSAEKYFARIAAECDGTPGTNDYPGRLVFSTTADGASSPTERLIINSSGTVLPATDNAYYLGVGSNRWIAVYAVNGTIQTSDKREKTEIQASALGIDFIKSLRPVSYKWNIGQNIVSKSDDGKTDVITPREGVRRHWGFIAQDVEESVNKAGVDFGGWLLEDKDDPDSRQALRYDQFIAPLTKALQEAIAKIETLEAEVAALKAQ
jgi:hypothetical protein